MSFASVYPLYINKVEKKGRTKTEVDQIILWLTGYSEKQLDNQLKKEIDFETFITEAPQLNPLRVLIKGVVCGVRVEDIEEPTMQEIRYLDKMIDELASGKVMEKIHYKGLRSLLLIFYPMAFQQLPLSQSHCDHCLLSPLPY